MPAQQYSVNHHPIQILLAWVQSGEIAIPEIQRPFVWDPVKVRNLLDSLYHGYPIGYLIAWRNPNVKLKDGSSSIGKRVLIDGQQRITALMAALLGREVVTKEYETTRIRIAFNPAEHKFEVSNPAIEKDPAWIPDVATAFAPSFGMFDAVSQYCDRNPGRTQQEIFESFQALSAILNNHVGLIELNSDLTIEVVTEIFIRVNSMGTELSQADFAMSKIASNETYGGSTLRKAIDYFCHLSVAPQFHAKLQTSDAEFAATEFFQKMSWLKNENDDIYDPSYTDMLRVAFTSEFKRGRLEDLVALLSGRNFETKQFEDSIAEASFAQLKQGILNFMNETHFQRFVMIVRSSGFIDAAMLGSQNALNFAYILYLILKAEGKGPADIEQAVRRWFVMSLLTRRYAGSIDSVFDSDIRQVQHFGFDHFADSLQQAELSSAYWDSRLPQALSTSSTASPYFRVFQASQIKANDKGFLSRDITVRDLVLNRSDVHHIFPRSHLKRAGMTRERYNQIANFAIAQTEINIAIGDTAPAEYFSYIKKTQCRRGTKRFGGIADLDEFRENLRAHCIPDNIDKMTHAEYDAFLEERRKLMAAKIKAYFQTL